MIGIITILKVNNYGAELQAFALCEKLNRSGLNSEIIDYPYYKNPRHIKTKLSKPYFKLTLIQRFKELFFPYLNAFKSIPYLKAKKIRDSKFHSFHEEFTPISPEFRKAEQLFSKKDWNYEVFISGSDQIWNPYSGGSIDPYLLSFVPEGKVRISYASSFGVNSLPENSVDFYKTRLTKYDFLSIREISGTRIVKNLLGLDIPWVLDPTFLLNRDDWEKFAISCEVVERFILIYALTDSDYIKEVARRISSEKGLKIVRLCKNASKEDSDPDIINIIDAGPREFLGLFLKASFVLTTSFHGVCFSLNFGVPFFSILKREKNNNSRQIDLLTYLGLESRILFVGDDLPNIDIPPQLLDSSKIKLEEKRAFSVNFLLQSIKGDTI